MDIDRAEGELQSDAYDSEGVGSAAKDTTNNDDLYGNIDNEVAVSMSLFEAAEDKDALYKALEPGPEAQL
jgi:hypothetical protein